jgi:hypothetical protein
MLFSARSLAPLFFFVLSHYMSHAQQWQWAKDLGVSGGYGHIAGDTKGNAFAITYTNLGQGDLSGTVQVSKLWKIDTGGNIAFTNPIGGRQEYSQLAVDGSDNLLVSGSCRDSIRFNGASFNPSLTAYVAALNGNGAWIWSDLSEDQYPFSFTSNSSQEVLFMRGTNVVCVNQSGGILWATSFTFATDYSTYGGYAFDLAIGNNDRVYVAGVWSGSVMTMNNVIYYNQPAGKGGSFIIELNSSGQLVKVDLYPYARFSEIKTDAAHNLYIMGTLDYNRTLYIGGASLKETMSSGPNTQSYFVAKLSASGTCNWIREMKKTDPGFPYSWGYQMDVSAAGNVFIAGYGTSTVKLSNYNIPADSSIFIVALDNNANPVWTNEVTSYNKELDVYGISVAGNSAVYILMDLLDSASFGNINLIAGTEFNNAPYTHYKHFAMAMINYVSLTTDIKEEGALNVNVRPNPAKGIFEIVTSEEIEKVNVFDLNGAEIINSALPGTNEIDISYSTPGLYFLRVTTAKGICTKKVVVD